MFDVEKPDAFRQSVEPRMLRKLAIGIFAAAGLCLSAPLDAAAAGARTYPVGPGDQLQVAVFGEENVSNALSGRFTVERDGTIFFPLLGRLDVTGKSSIEIAEILREQLSGQVPVSLSSVMIAEFAPVYLVGDVSRTGPFAFKPDMTVYDLVLDAGGVTVPDAYGARLALQEQLSVLELTRQSLVVRKARLLAELEGTEFDPQSVKDIPSGDIEGIVAAESKIFAMQEQATQARQTMLEERRKGYDQEISSLEESISLHDEGVRLLEEQVAARQKLADKGLAASSTVSDLKRQLTATRRDALEFRTALFRARQDRFAVDHNFRESEISLDLDNVRELRQVELDIERNEVETISAEAKFARLDFVVAGDGDDAPLREPTYTVVRKTDGENVATVVGQDEILQRGDIVRVSFDLYGDTAKGAPPSEVTQLGNQVR